MKKISSHGKGLMVIYIYINLKQALFLYPIMKYFPNIVGTGSKNRVSKKANRRYKAYRWVFIGLFTPFVLFEKPNTGFLDFTGIWEWKMR